MKSPKIIFYLGKGGSGKSTVSALAALAAARRGEKTVLASMDAAHNLSDIFHTALAHTPRPMAPHLFVAEIDQEKMIRRYLKETRQALKRNYAYLTAFNLEKHFDILKFSPGLEEYALILAFREILETWTDADRLIFDMPPTALSLKFFNLPLLSEEWISRLEALREEINRKKEIVNRIKLAGKNWDRDPIIAKIKEMKAGYRFLIDLFRDNRQVHLHGVLNPNPLSVSETERIHQRLAAMGMKLASVIWNQPHGTGVHVPMPLSFVPPIQYCLPTAQTPLTGLDALYQYLATLDPKDSPF